jgi:molybdopterin synthase sulfur carrier subunit
MECASGLRAVSVVSAASRFARANPVVRQRFSFSSSLIPCLVSITLYLPTVLSRFADGKVLAAQGETVGDVVDDVTTRFPALAPRLRDEAGNPYPFVTFYLNDEDIRFHGGFGAAVTDGDELTIVPAIAGG